MRRRKKKRIGRIFGVLLGIVLFGLCILLVVLSMQSYRLNTELYDMKTNLEKENAELSAKLTDLHEETVGLEKDLQELEEKMQELEEPQSVQSEAVEENTMIQPPSSSGLFSEGTGLEPGSIIDPAQVAENPAAYFQKYDIVEGDAIYNRINGKSYRANDNIGLSDLKYLKILHYNFEHQIQVGEIIVNEAISEDVLNIFRELYDAEYEIQSVYLVDNYWAGDGDSTDTASIEVNNTSAFNYREVTGGGNLSNHAYGCAIDINPQQNPYVWYYNGQAQWTHSNASDYIDRTSGNPHVIVAGDTCHSIFTKYGFSWGGDWSNPVDYQHFEKVIY